jgi:hypothetical protein
MDWNTKDQFFMMRLFPLRQLYRTQSSGGDDCGNNSKSSVASSWKRRQDLQAKHTDGNAASHSAGAKGRSCGWRLASQLPHMLQYTPKNIYTPPQTNKKAAAKARYFRSATKQTHDSAIP